MVVKRNFECGEGSGSEKVLPNESKRRSTFQNDGRNGNQGFSVQESSYVESLLTGNEGFSAQESSYVESLLTGNEGFSAQESSYVESFLRGLVRSEVNRVLSLPHVQSSLRASVNRNGASEPRRWQLKFTNSLPGTIYTSNDIEAKGNTPVEIEIIDATSKTRVTTHSLSSIKIEIFALKGDFVDEGNEEWCEMELEASLIRERVGKRPILAGDRCVSLKNGVGYLGDLYFTDNSSWTRCRKFKLGARVVGSTPNKENIREAISGAFMVKDQRGEGYQKHEHPNLSDEIWRLNKIGKDGVFHNRLVAEGIKTVQDFLRLLTIDPSSLRSKFGNGMSNKIWTTIVRHANKCTLDNKMYAYCDSGQPVIVLFDSIFKVIGAYFEGQNYLSRDNFGISHKNLVEDLKKYAYQNLDSIVEFTGPPGAPPAALPLQASTSYIQPSIGMQRSAFQITNQDEPATHLNSDTVNSLLHASDDEYKLEHLIATPGFHPVEGCIGPFQSNFTMGSSSTAYGASEPLAPGMNEEPLSVDDMLHSQTSTPGLTILVEENNLFLSPSDEIGIQAASSLSASGQHINRNGISSPKWTKLLAPLKWVSIVKRNAAIRRRTQLLPNYIGSALRT